MCGTQWIEATQPFTEPNPCRFRPESECCDFWRDLSLPLLLPEAQVCALHKITGQMNATGSEIHSGMFAVFTGCDAAGKLMAAEALAYETEHPLQRIDAGEISSLSTAEGERYFVLVLNAARNNNAILMLDNADRLPHALIKTLEDHRGLSILAADAPQDLFETFRGKKHYVVDFPFPFENE